MIRDACRLAALLLCARISTGCGSDELLRSEPAFDPFVLDSPPEARDLDPDDATVRVRLRAARATHRIGDQNYDGYAYNDSLPGPTIRARVGDLLVVELENALDADTTIHWHGLRVPYAMDGVTWQSDPVKPGETFTYSFALTHAGTFWYHPHFDSERQVDWGLYGALVVEEPSEPVLDGELVLIFDSWGEAGESASGSAHTSASSFAPAHEEGSGSLAPLWTVNGRVEPELPATSGSARRVRLVNASANDYLALSWPSIRQIASDQGLLASLAEPDPLLLAPGDRAETEWLVGPEPFAVAAEPYSLHGGAALGSAVELFRTLPTGGQPAPPPTSWSLPDAPAPVDPGFTDVVYVFTGDPVTNDWRINGELFPDVTVETLELGADTVIEVRNASATEHPFHLHGHAFEVMSLGATPPEQRMLEDTINVPIGASVRLRFVADNPGDWMAHCHVLSHAEGGMMTVLRIAP